MREYTFSRCVGAVSRKIPRYRTTPPSLEVTAETEFRERTVRSSFSSAWKPAPAPGAQVADLIPLSPRTLPSSTTVAPRETNIRSMSAAEEAFEWRRYG